MNSEKVGCQKKRKKFYIGLVLLVVSLIFQNFIEYYLDILLNMNIKEAESEFYKLCSYYENVNYENALEYYKIYCEIYSENISKKIYEKIKKS